MAENDREPLLDRLIDPLRQVAGRPGCFFLVLLALRSVARPYAGLAHDAKLYAVQVMNRTTEGFFDGDLYFLYGSQDNYSVFSLLMSPLAGVLGLTGAFFLGYVVCSAAVIFAQMRLVRCLIPDRLIGSLALVLLAVTDVPYGGQGVLNVHEGFLTARLPAVALTLLALERLCNRRYFAAGFLSLGAIALHPLMGLTGLAVTIAVWAVDKLPRAVVAALALLVTVAVAVVLLWQPLGIRLLGFIDPVWYDILLHRNTHLFPTNWSLADWWRIIFSAVVVLIGLRYVERPFRVVMLLIVLAALAGVSLHTAAEWRPYALLLQGQPARALWLLQFLAVPIGVLVTFRLWQQGTSQSRGGAILVACFTGELIQPSFFTLESIGMNLALLVCLVGIAAAVLRSRARHIGEPEWLGSSVLIALAVYGLWTSIGVVCSLGRLLDAEVEDPVRLIWLITRPCSDAIVAGVAVLLIAGLWRLARDVRRAGLIAAVVWIVLSSAAFFVRADSRYRERFIRDHADLGFVRQFLHEQAPNLESRPVVYWPTDVVHVWFGIPARSFYSWEQTVGSLFDRRTALEGQRRVRVVWRFEIDRMREFSHSGSFLIHRLSVFDSYPDEPPPTEEDLRVLCREEGLDYVILTKRFEGLVKASNDNVFIYDCRALRADLFGNRLD